MMIAVPTHHALVRFFRIDLLSTKRLNMSLSSVPMLIFRIEYKKACNAPGGHAPAAASQGPWKDGMLWRRHFVHGGYLLSEPPSLIEKRLCFFVHPTREDVCTLRDVN